MKINFIILFYLFSKYLLSIYTMIRDLCSGSLSDAVQYVVVLLLLLYSCTQDIRTNPFFMNYVTSPRMIDQS